MHQDVKPGRELDALVAERVMGWAVERNTVDSEPIVMFSKPGEYYGPVPPYSTDIAAAWEVVEKLSMAPNPATAPAIYPPHSAVDPHRYNGSQWMVRLYRAKDE